MLDSSDVVGLIHPALAVAVIFPLLGMVLYMAWQTRQRRLALATVGKSKVPAGVGPEHLLLGRWLSTGVVALTLLGLAHPIFSKFAANQTWAKEFFRASFVTVIFLVTLVSLTILYLARQKLWRGVFATLTGMGVIVLGSQPEVFRREFEWWVSHYYYGIIVTMLMVFSLAIFPDIYEDRSNRWRKTHIILNSIAVLFFISQAFTGTRDLLEIPLNWQEPVIQQLYEKQCQTQPCTVQPAPPKQK
jgi:hypothetical protein